ncbi:serine hydrolase domain-containing protein [Herbivorax sp. ANBcel31]|uniref:serine hydrolase domain-containing protein n=1 Tax=Herbivorax sp. ANBcel31 TaxID=3069754 RepID=UPI0027B1C201|nr:serine hydrolase domain-containing protein [Herbivorax sp. ANBcel31]MDQ2087271.1 serine hydrolase domain-containing protein [Herbivorax sp. ANBcel31]
MVELLKGLNDEFDYHSEVQDVIINSDFELLFEPGKQYSYSNVGYGILGKVIEEVSQMSYIDYLNKIVFKPLNMENTWLFEEELDIYSRPLSDEYDDEEYLKELRKFHSTLSNSGGALFSNVEDMSKYSQVFTTDKVLKKETIEKMCTPIRDNYGLGVWSRQKDFIGHDGIFYDGFFSIFTINIEDDIKVIYFCDRSVNTAEGVLDAMWDRIIRAINEG